MGSVSNQYAPDFVTPPGDTLAELLEERKTSQAALAERMGRPKQFVNELIMGKAAITADTALQLERVLKVPASFWNNREAHFRDYLTRVSEAKRLAESKDWVTQFPVRDMVHWGWIEDCKNTVEKARALLNFFGVASPDQWSEVWQERHYCFRKTKAFKSSFPALTAWLRQGEIEGEKIKSQPYRPAHFREALTAVRSLTRVRDPKKFLPRLIDTCASAGVAVVFVPAPKGCRASGATQWLSPDKALIQLSLRYKTDDQLWFTFFHEAAHILKHEKKEIFIEDDRPDDEREAEADRFAADFLIPRTAFAQISQTRPSLGKIRLFARDVGISPGIVVGRLQHEGIYPMSHGNGLKVRYEFKTE